jgi:hypothetical protein
MSNLFKSLVIPGPDTEFLLPKNSEKLKTLLCFLGLVPGYFVERSHDAIVQEYRRGMERLSDSMLVVPANLEKSIAENFQTITPFQQLIPRITADVRNNLEIPLWLLLHLCEEKWVNFVRAFASCLQGSVSAGQHLKTLIIHQPCTHYYKPPAYDTIPFWHCEPDFLVNHYRDYPFLANHWFHFVSDWRSECFEMAIAALCLFRKAGGVINGQMIYDMAIERFDRDLLYYQFLPKTLGYLLCLLSPEGEHAKGLYWLYPKDEDKLTIEWRRRFPDTFGGRPEAFGQLQIWFHDALVLGKPFSKDRSRDTSPQRSPAKPVVEFHKEQEEFKDGQKDYDELNDVNGCIVAVRGSERTGKEEVWYVKLHRQEDGSMKSQPFGMTKRGKNACSYELIDHMDPFDRDSVLVWDVPIQGNNLVISKKQRIEHRRQLKKSIGVFGEDSLPSSSN